MTDIGTPRGYNLQRTLVGNDLGLLKRQRKLILRFRQNEPAIGTAK